MMSCQRANAGGKCPFLSRYRIGLQAYQEPLEGKPELALERRKKDFDFLAKMLGLCRASVTTALHELTQAGAIRVAWSEIINVDRALLKSLTCYCYTVIKDAFQRPIPDQPQPGAHPASDRPYRRG
jgi:hypothetical protein